MLEGHVAVGRVEQLLVINPKARADGHLAGSASQRPDKTVREIRAIGKTYSRRKITFTWIFKERPPKGGGRISGRAHVRDFAIDFRGYRDELVTQPQIECQIRSRFPVILKIHADQILLVMPVDVLLRRVESDEISGPASQKI